jgi:hypothetical protein
MFLAIMLIVAQNMSIQQCQNPLMCHRQFGNAASILGFDAKNFAYVLPIAQIDGLDVTACAQSRLKIIRCIIHLVCNSHEQSRSVQNSTLPVCASQS